MKSNVSNEYGHCYYCVCDDKDCAMLYNLYIKEEHRRKGHAKELVQKAIDELRTTGYKQDIKIVAEPEEKSLTKKDLVEFYKRMNLKVVDSQFHKNVRGLIK
ncbi:MAG: GNAT family N-acetyltransferase [Clostridium sp.]